MIRRAPWLAIYAAIILAFIIGMAATEGLRP